MISNRGGWTHRDYKRIEWASGEKSRDKSRNKSRDKSRDKLNKSNGGSEI